MYRKDRSTEQTNAPGTRLERKKRRISPLLLAVVGVLCCSLLATGLFWESFARYISKKEVGNQVAAKPFYFTVGLLGDADKPEETEKEYHLYGGGQQIVKFVVQNYYDSDRVTEYETKYTISYEADNNAFSGTLTLKDSNDETVSSGQQQSLAAGTSGSTMPSHSYALDIPIYDKTARVTVTIKSIEPYEKTLKLTFVLDPTPQDVMWRVVDDHDSPYAELIVMSAVHIPVGNLTVDWSDVNQDSYTLKVDSTNPYVLSGDLKLTGSNDPDTQTVKRLDKITSTGELKVRESISIYLFKDDPTKSYATATDQVAEESGAEGNKTYTVKMIKQDLEKSKTASADND